MEADFQAAHVKLTMAASQFPGYEGTAIFRPGALGKWSCGYLNNIVEQDHRRVKFRMQPMLGFKKFSNARRVLMGIELVQKIIKGQFRIPAHFGRNLGSIWRAALTS